MVSLTNAVSTRTVNEGGYFKYTSTLLDEDSTALALASVDTLTMTLYEVQGDTVINSRSAQDVLNTNSVTLHATSGLLTWTALAADNPIVNSPGAGEYEQHIAVFTLTYSTTKTLNHEVAIYVKQLNEIT